MAASGFTPISLYYSTTASSAPTAGNLTNGELAINITDGKLYYKDNAGVVQVIAGKGGAGVAGGSNTQVQFNSSGNLAGSANLTFDGTTLTPSALTVTGATALNGGTTIGDASGDSFTINSSAVSIPNGLNFDSNTFVIDATNNRVGINQASPTTSLQITRGSGGALRVNSTGANQIFAQVDNTTNTTEFGVLAAGEAYISSNGAYSQIFYTNGSERMRITSTGNVGIGTSTITERLTVSGNIRLSSTNQIQFFDSNYFVRASTGLELQSSDLIRFLTNGANERMRIDSSGNVGIGTSSPSHMLDVGGGSGSRVIRINGASSGNDNGGALFIGNGGTTVGAFGNYSTIIGGSYNADPLIWAGLSRSLIFVTGGGANERMRIDSSGNVGIGTSSPSGWNGRTLSVASSTNDAGIRLDGNLGSWGIGGGGTATGSNALRFYNFTSSFEAMRIDSSGNVGIGTFASAGDTLRYLDISNTNTGSSAGAIIRLITSNAAASGITSVDLVKYKVGGFIIGNNDTASSNYTAFVIGGTERMRIDSSGSVGIGTSSPATPLSVVRASSASIQASTGTVDFRVQSIDAGSAAYVGTISNHACVFTTNNTERMRIDSSGNALFAKAVRATITTDNDLSFDMNAASNFKCTPTAGGALTFTNITSGQTGNIILVNGANYAITAAATTKVSATCLATISATGTYWLSYYSDGTNVYVANTGALA